MGRAAHLGVDSLVVRLPAGVREVMRHAVTALVAVFAGILGWQGAALVPVMATQRSPSMGLSLQYVVAVIPLAAAIMLGLQIKALARAWASQYLWTGVAFVVAGAAARHPRRSDGRGVAIGGGARADRHLGLPHRRQHAHRVRGGPGLRRLPAPARGCSRRGRAPPRDQRMDSFLLLALPLFVLAGDLMNTGGITERLVGCRARAGGSHPRRPRDDHRGQRVSLLRNLGLLRGGCLGGRLAADPGYDPSGLPASLGRSIVAAASAMGVLCRPAS